MGVRERERGTGRQADKHTGKHNRPRQTATPPLHDRQPAARERCEAVKPASISCNSEEMFIFGCVRPDTGRRRDGGKERRGGEDVRREREDKRRDRNERRSEVKEKGEEGRKCGRKRRERKKKGDGYEGNGNKGIVR